MDSERTELLSSLNELIYLLTILSYLLSPAHILTLLLRLLTQSQLNHSIITKLSLRSLIGIGLGINAGNGLVHALEGSRGTKGMGWTGKGGLLIDFVGQGWEHSLSAYAEVMRLY